MSKLQTGSQRVTTTLTRSVSCHGSLTSLTTLSRSLARFATHSKNRTKFIWRIYPCYQSNGKFLCCFVSWDLKNKMISRRSISNPAMFFKFSKCQNVQIQYRYLCSTLFAQIFYVVVQVTFILKKFSRFCYSFSSPDVLITASWCYCVIIYDHMLVMSIVVQGTFILKWFPRFCCSCQGLFQSLNL